MTWSPEIAVAADVPALEALIPLSVRALQSPWYSVAQMEAALGPVFGVDRQLITDGTYYVIRQEGRIIAAGGWSRRRSLFGGDRNRPGPDPELNPAADAARIRAFFVHPEYARRGLGRSLLAACEAAIRAAGFTHAELVATLAGEPLYAAAGYAATRRYEIPLKGEMVLPVVHMVRSFTGRDL